VRTALTLSLCVILAGCASPVGSTPNTDVQAAATPAQPASAARITPPPVTPPTPPGTNLPAFACSDTSGGAAGTANVVGVRVAEANGYDRFVIQFDTSVPSYTVKRQSSSKFTAGASGQPLTLSGTAGALVRIHSASESGTYSGPTDFTHSEFLVLKEARLTEDFEGYVSWGLGVSRAGCLRSFTLANPPRLVVDFSTTGG
jgi:hypothetical protein